MINNTIQLDPEFLADGIMPPPYTLYRHDGHLGRYYYKLNDSGSGTPVSIYPSVTTLIKSVFGEDEYLVKWKVEKGEFEGQRIAKEKADYGTLMHILFANLLRNNVVDFNELPSKVETYNKSLRYTPPFDWTNKAAKHVLSLIQFLHDRNVKVIASEYPLASDKLGFASLIDAVFEMDALNYSASTPPEKRERILVIIDFKSNEEGAVYDSYKMQGFMYRELWNEHHPDMPIDCVGNWFPSDWRDSPSYKLVWHDAKGSTLGIQEKIEAKKKAIQASKDKVESAIKRHEKAANPSEAGKKKLEGQIANEEANQQEAQAKIEQLEEEMKYTMSSMEEQMPMRLQLMAMAAPKIKPKVLNTFGRHSIDTPVSEMYAHLGTAEALAKAAVATQNPGFNFRAHAPRTMDVRYFATLQEAQQFVASEQAEPFIVELFVQQRWQPYDANDPAHISYASTLEMRSNVSDAKIEQSSLFPS